MNARKRTCVSQFSWATGTTFLGLTIPDLSLRNIWSTKVTTTVVDGGVEGPRSLKRCGRTSCALSGNEAGKESGGGGKGCERTHFYWDRWSATGRTMCGGSGV